MTHVEAPPVESIEDFAARQAEVDKQFLETIDHFKNADSAGTVAVKAAEVQDPRDVEAETKSEAAWEKRS